MPWLSPFITNNTPFRNGPSQVVHINKGFPSYLLSLYQSLVDKGVKSREADFKEVAGIGPCPIFFDAFFPSARGIIFADSCDKTQGDGLQVLGSN